MFGEKKVVKTKCGKEISVNRYFRHLKSCFVCERDWKDIMDGKYDLILQDIVDEVDFREKALQETVSERITPIVGKRMREELIDYLMKKKIFPQEWTRECPCGVRFKDVRAYLGHTSKCKVYREWKENIKKDIFQLDKIKDALVNRDLTMIEYLEENGINHNVHASIYQELSKFIDELINEGKLNYQKIMVADLSRNKKIKEKQNKTVMERYGVENVSQINKVKQKKKETSRKNWNADHWLKSEKGKKIKAQQLYEKYGVTNISQLDEVKEKKRNTFIKNYGVDNIFKRVDLMNIEWDNKLEVVNPMYLKKDIGEKYYKFKKKIDINGEKYIILSETEYKYIKQISDLKKMYPSLYKDLTIRANDSLLISDKKDSAYLIDILLYDEYPIEIKNTMVHIGKNIEKAKNLSKQKMKNFILASVNKNVIAFYMDLYRQQKVYYYLSHTAKGDSIVTVCEKNTNHFYNNSVKFINLKFYGVNNFKDTVEFLLGKIIEHRENHFFETV